MKALEKSHAQFGIWMTEQPYPDLADHDVLIKIKKTAICGTDLHIYKWDEWAQKTLKTPLVVGHEFIGHIEALGCSVTHLRAGDRVSGEGHVVCGHCRPCRRGQQHLCPNTQGIGIQRPGAFAEYMTIPADNIVPVPDSIPDDIAAIFDPFGNAVHTALAFPCTGQNVLVTGAGPTGLMAAAIAKHAGAHKVVLTDVNPYRLELAKSLGITHAINIAETSLQAVCQQLNIRAGFDIGLEMSGNKQALHSMIQQMVNGGHIALLGIYPNAIEIDWNSLIFKGLTLKGIYGREMYKTWQQMLALLDSGLDISPVVTHTLPVDDFQQGFDVMLSGQCGKVVLDWSA